MSNQPHKKPEPGFSVYDAVMNFDFKADAFASHFAAAGIDDAVFNLEIACKTHRRLMSDAVLVERRAAEIEKRQAAFSSRPFAGRFEESLRLADGVVEHVLAQMTPQERADLRRRVTR
jgi:hypothetical protein